MTPSSSQLRLYRLPQPTERVHVSGELLGLLRAERERLERAAPGGRWSYERVIRVLLLHWQARPGALPEPDELTNIAEWGR